MKRLILYLASLCLAEKLEKYKLLVFVEKVEVSFVNNH